MHKIGLMRKVISLLFLLGVAFGTQAFVLCQQKDCRGVWDQGAMRDRHEEIVLHFQAMFQGKIIALEEPLRISPGDSLALHTLRFYLSNFVFLKNDTVVFEEKNSYHLLDLENENSLSLEFEEAPNMDFDHIQFKLGIDSLTHISGVMGGDLDPTKGMLWAWQSGYINVKLEGFSEKCPTRNHEFQFHLGGYLAPFQSVQTISLSVPKRKNLLLLLDLTPFFEQVDWAKKNSIMSPSKEAVAFSKILANSFSIHAK